MSQAVGKINSPKLLFYSSLGPVYMSLVYFLAPCIFELVPLNMEKVQLQEKNDQLSAEKRKMVTKIEMSSEDKNKIVSFAHLIFHDRRAELEEKLEEINREYKDTKRELEEINLCL